MTQAELVYRHLQQLPESLVSEVFDFVKFLEQKQPRLKNQEPRQPGSARGLIWMADDFDAPRETGADMKTKYKETACSGLAVNIIEMLRH